MEEQIIQKRWKTEKLKLLDGFLTKVDGDPGTPISTVDKPSAMSKGSVDRCRDSGATSRPFRKRIDYISDRKLKHARRARGQEGSLSEMQRNLEKKPDVSNEVFQIDLHKSDFTSLNIPIRRVNPLRLYFAIGA
ncbi:PREDICTED: uncharacterized protein LOC108971445 [Bactrocera latifrons]|uniref:uncharacterized protein LOC108971443 n=1 Tax=Bactrocera latifrons TaxID=174628 RepID=UPI0008DD2516|nr:PREDICTED: uncharacterized protein LOC108971443 [Bactrocera latifrons]XP_018793044.1 PREDICTED: uncharacterized protein LOC108971445 [Bactrocera latifrons]